VWSLYQLPENAWLVKLTKCGQIANFQKWPDLGHVDHMLSLCQFPRYVGAELCACSHLRVRFLSPILCLGGLIGVRLAAWCWLQDVQIATGSSKRSESGQREKVFSAVIFWATWPDLVPCAFCDRCLRICSDMTSAFCSGLRVCDQ
jgi:hypothetical protein